MVYQNYALVALGCVISYFLVTKLVNYIEAVRFSKAHGCKPVVRIPQSERILGYQMVQQQLQEKKNKILLSSGQKRYDQYGDTFQFTASGLTFVTTIDPENVKAVLATNFKDFGLGHRLAAFGPLFGSGIFTTDGAHWEHSRVCIRATLLSFFYCAKSR